MNARLGEEIKQARNVLVDVIIKLDKILPSMDNEMMMMMMMKNALLLWVEK